MGLFGKMNKKKNHLLNVGIKISKFPKTHNKITINNLDNMFNFILSPFNVMISLNFKYLVSFNNLDFIKILFINEESTFHHISHHL